LLFSSAFSARASLVHHAHRSFLVLSRKGEPALQRWADRARGNWCVSMLSLFVFLLAIDYCDLSSCQG
jgi:hypothetical protein